MPLEEELLVDCCFKHGDGDVVRYENVDKPVWLDAGDVGERWYSMRKDSSGK